MHTTYTHYSNAALTVTEPVSPRIKPPGIHTVVKTEIYMLPLTPTVSVFEMGLYRGKEG